MSREGVHVLDSGLAEAREVVGTIFRSMKARTYTATLVREGSMCIVPVPFDPAPVFGKVRAPVKVTLNGYTYRSTIAAMGGPLCIPLRKSNREAAGLEGNETLKVRHELDADARVVTPPPSQGAEVGATRMGPLARAELRVRMHRAGASRPSTVVRKRMERAVLDGTCPLTTWLVAADSRPWASGSCVTVGEAEGCRRPEPTSSWASPVRSGRTLDGARSRASRPSS